MEVEKIDHISPREFYNRYVKPGIPVVLKNASQSWKANKIFTPEYFNEHFGDRKTDFKDRMYTMSEILELTRQSTSEKPAPYPLRYEIPLQLPELMEAFDPIHLNYSKPNWLRSNLIPYGGNYGNGIHLHLGGQGNSYGLHKDSHHTNAWLTQLYGEKDFIVFPRDQEPLLYPMSKGKDILNTRSPINILNPDYEKYPRYRDATPIRVTVLPGETIFIPNGIWHTTISSCQNISLIYDQVNWTNFNQWSSDIYHYNVAGSKFKANIKYTLSRIVGYSCRVGEIFGRY